MKAIVITCIMLLIVCPGISQVIITDGSAVPATSAMLDVNSTTRGFRFPRLSNSQRNLLPSPATGLLIYNSSTNRFNYYNGMMWHQIDATLNSNASGSLSPGGGTGVFTYAGTAHNSTLLDIQNTTRGLLIPRTVPDSITNPDTGLIIYNLAAGRFSFFDGTSWRDVCSTSLGVTGAGGSQTATGVAINAAGSNPDQSSIFDVSAVHHGLLIPRMTDLQRNAILPVTGLTIYNTTSKNIQFNTGSGWYMLNAMPGSPVAGVHGHSGTRITWNWSAVAGATGYKWGTVNNPALAADLGNKTTYTEHSLQCQTLYTRYAWAYNTCGLSVPVVMVKATSGDPPANPPPLSNFSSLFSIDWRWDYVENAIGFKWNTVNDYNTATDLGLDYSHIETGLQCGMDYIRYVWAYDSCEHSAVTILADSTWNCPGAPCPGMASISYGGQNYNTVQIGLQCWLKENLNVGEMIDGQAEQSNDQTIQKYCYANVESNCAIYGGLYQWDEMMNYTTQSAANPSGRQGICPAGWHIPSHAEWTQLSTLLGGNNVTGGMLKETGTAHWLPPNTGADNFSGFTALPAGGRKTNGNFDELFYRGYFWTTTMLNVSWPSLFYPTYNSASLFSTMDFKANGYSCRCVRN